MSAETDPQSPRARQAETIKRAPQNYKVCEGCDSIVAMKAATCPSCHSYRFDGNPERVVSQATLLGSREQQSVTASDFY